MIPPMDTVTTTSAKAIHPRALRLALPLLEAVALLATGSRRRIIRTGRSGSGAGFSKYARGSRRHGPKRFLRTGTMWRSLRVRLSTPTRAVAGFSGRAAEGARKTKKGKTVRITNAALGKILQSKERADIIGPTRVELATFEDAMAAALGPQAMEALGFEAVAFKAERRGRSAERKARKAMRELRR